MHAYILQERQMKEHRVKEIEEDVDYLAPYIARLGSPVILTVEQATQARDQCLEEFTVMLVERANDIQRQFERVSRYITSKYTTSNFANFRTRIICKRNKYGTPLSRTL